tara:strand:- start:359 stop:646 length:288 start_codon:yes stop_codon:yes gene_type:complete
MSSNNSKVQIGIKNNIMFELLDNEERKEELGNLINEIFHNKYEIELIKVVDSDNNLRNGEEFKFKEKKDKLLESESVKNLFDAFDCRIQDVEVEN